MQRLFSIIQLIRLHNCIIAGAGVWVGAYLADVPHDNIYVYLTSLAAALACGAGNAFNDFFDVESDRINHPHRPLPSGRIKLFHALVTAFILGIFSLITAALVNPIVLIIIFLILILVLFYSLKLKKIILLGNLAVATAGAMPFVLGGLTPAKTSFFTLPGIWVPTAFALVFHFGRELVKDMADLKGDTDSRLRTLPALVSPSVFMAVVTAVFILLIIMTLIPLNYDWYGIFYTYIVILLVDTPLVLLIIYLWLSRRKKRFAESGSIFKLLMVAGLVAFIGGKI